MPNLVAADECALRTPAAPARPDRSAVRARIAVTLLFLLMGTTAGSWAARVPDVQKAVGLSDAGWGYTNMTTTAGSLTSLLLVAVLIGRVRTRRLALIGATVLLANAPLQAHASSLPALIAGLLTWGLSANLLSTPMNAQAVLVEQRYGRPVLSTIHAGFSVGMLAGGLLGTIATSTGISPSTQLAASSLVLGSLLLATWRWLPADRPRRPGPGTAATGRRRERLAARFSPQLLLLAMIAFLASFCQGAVSQWSAIYTSRTLSAGAVAGAVTFTCTAVAEAFARFSGDRLLAKVGRIRFLRLSTAVAGAGVAVAVAGGTAVTAWIGFGMLGLGMGCVLPTVFGLAGDQPGLTPGEGISVTVMGQWPAFLIAPALIGTLAGLVGLRLALLLLVCAALSATLLTGRIRPPLPRPAGEPERAGVPEGAGAEFTAGSI